MLSRWLMTLPTYKGLTMSGLFGYFSTEPKDVFTSIYFGIYALQHRGQQSSGIATVHDGEVDLCVGPGLIKRSFARGKNDDLKGSKGVGFVKYKFRYDHTPDMPIQRNGAVMVFDGVVTNEGSVFDDLWDRLEGECADLREYLLSLEGAFSFIYVNDDKMIAYRDMKGIKPLCIGYDSQTTIVATESCAIESIGARFVRDLQPGEIFIHTANGQTSYYLSNETSNICAFEFIYTARPDSVIDNISVYDARYRLGKMLSLEAPVEADIVIGAPDSGVIAALGYAKESGIPFQEGFVRNRYVGRTFIEETQVERERGIQIKLTPIRGNIMNRDIILIDDSIVRGTTIKRIVKNLKEKGANKVHVRIAAPQIVSSNNLTVDIPDNDELIAYEHNIEEMKAIIGCDSLAFLSLNGLYKAIGRQQMYGDYFERTEA